MATQRRQVNPLRPSPTGLCRPSLTLSLASGASTRATFWSFNVLGIAPQTTASTAINFETPNPVSTDMLSVPLYQGCRYDGRFNAWQLSQQGSFMKFNLVLDQPRLVALTMNDCAMTVGGAANCPFSISVNGNILVNNYSPQNNDFTNQQWLVPANWVVAGNNTVMLSLSGSASTTLDFKSFGAAAQILPAQTGSITFGQKNGRVSCDWSAMPNATSYEIELYMGTNLTTPVFSTKGFLSTGMVLPGDAKPGVYTVRVRPWVLNVPGDWTPMTAVTLARSIFFLSPIGQQNPAAARLALESLGIVVFGTVDNLHFEGLADADQISAAGSQSPILAAYGGALSAAQIAQLPANQQGIAQNWNYYYSPQYQQILANTTNEGISWGDATVNSPPISMVVPPHMLRDLVQPSSLDAKEANVPVERLSRQETKALHKRLQAHLQDETAAAHLTQSFAVLPPEVREKLLAPELREHLLAMANVNPKVAMRGTMAVGVVIVQSNAVVGGSPTNWKVQTAVAAGAASIQIIGGANDPEPGDSFTIDAFAFTVSAWNPQTLTISINPATPGAIDNGKNLVVVSAPRTGPQFSAADTAVVEQKARDAFQGIQRRAPQFRPNNWVTSAAVPAGALSFVVAGGLSFPCTGDTFTLPGNGASYTITSFEPRSGTVQVSSAMPATNAGVALTFPDTQNLRIVTQIYPVQINVKANDYDPNDAANLGDSYWVLPAVAQVQVGGANFPPTWAGLESLRQAVQAAAGASNASLLFMSAFPTDWMAFAQGTVGKMDMCSYLRTFSVSYTAAQAAQFDARDQASTRTWLNAGGLGTNISIGSAEPLAITVQEAGKRWSVATQVTNSVTGRTYPETYWILAVGGATPTNFAVFEPEGWGLPRWNQVIEHETYHLFDAPDEYGGKGTPCASCGGSYGVFNIPNGNCAVCANPQQICVMNSSNSAVCDYTRSAIGWSDVLVEVTTDPTSANNNDPMWVKLGDGLMFRLSDPDIDDRMPGSVDAYELGYTRLTRANIQTIAVGNGNPAEITTPWKIKRIRVWVQGALIYDQDNLSATVDSTHPWFIAPNFSGNISGYEVTITTGTKWFAGTGDDVYLTLGGKKVLMNEFVILDDAPYGGYTGFPSGSVKTTVLSPNGIDIPNNQQVILYKDIAIWEGLFGGDDWYPAHIKIVAHRSSTLWGRFRPFS